MDIVSVQQAVGGEPAHASCTREVASNQEQKISQLVDDSDSEAEPSEEQDIESESSISEPSVADIEQATW